MKVKNSDLNNLFLLPKNFPKIEEFPEKIKLLQEKSAFYAKLMALEQEIQPILQKIESTGIEIANDWFDVGLLEQRANLVKIQSMVISLK